MLSLFAITATQHHLITPYKEINPEYFGLALKVDTTCLYSIEESVTTLQ